MNTPLDPVSTLFPVSLSCAVVGCRLLVGEETVGCCTPERKSRPNERRTAETDSARLNSIRDRAAYVFTPEVDRCYGALDGARPCFRSEQSDCTNLRLNSVLHTYQQNADCSPSLPSHTAPAALIQFFSNRPTR